MKVLRYLLVIHVVASCGYDVANSPPPCDPEPVSYQIVWKMGITTQEATLIVKPGDTVRWVWGEDDMPHNITSEDSNAPDDFGSEIMIGMGSVYEYVFLYETSFDYLCSIHPTMMFGTITVAECEE